MKHARPLIFLCKKYDIVQQITKNESHNKNRVSLNMACNHFMWCFTTFLVPKLSSIYYHIYLSRPLYHIQNKIENQKVQNMNRNFAVAVVNVWVFNFVYFFQSKVYPNWCRGQPHHQYQQIQVFYPNCIILSNILDPV